MLSRRFQDSCFSKFIDSWSPFHLLFSRFWTTGTMNLGITVHLLVCAWTLHPKTRNQETGMLEVPWLAVELREWFAVTRWTFPWPTHHFFPKVSSWESLSWMLTQKPQMDGRPLGQIIFLDSCLSPLSLSFDQLMNECPEVSNNHWIDKWPWETFRRRPWHNEGKRVDHSSEAVQKFLFLQDSSFLSLPNGDYRIDGCSFLLQTSSFLWSTNSG